LADETEVSYQMSQPYDPACARGVRWDDPAFGIVWPVPIVLMSERDRQHADFSF
jgi:dTDP-4-dehydrorhamnose 3,5-epimerase